MSSNNCNTEQVKKDGSSQGDRYLKALDPANAAIDDRSMEEILVFAKHYAALVRFFDKDEQVEWLPGSGSNSIPGNKVVYDWKEFFYKDIAVVVASIAGYKNKLDDIKFDYDERSRQTNSNPVIQNLREQFKLIAHMMQRMSRWYARSIAGHPLRTELELKISSILKPALKKLMAYDRGSAAVKKEGLELAEEYVLFNDVPWGLNYAVIAADESIYSGTENKDRIKYASMYVDDIFQETLKVYKEITDRSNYYLTVALEDNPDHEPHMALFIAFAKLFMHAQQEMNGLTQRHLEFYYRDVLHLHERAATPDAVYLIYELAKEATAYELKKDTALTGGKDATGKELIYKTESDLVINKAKVKELKTIFLRRNEDDMIDRIFAAPVANSADGKGKPFDNPESAWPALGYFEPDENTILLDTEVRLGFAVASPQLFLAEGTRSITIKFSFGQEVDFTKQKVQPLQFKILLTGEKNWIAIDRIVPVLTPNIKAVKEMQMIIRLPVSEQPVVAYDEKIHGVGFKTSYPVIQFILPPDNAYNILKDAAVSEVLISVNVNGVKTLMLENDQSVLDASKSMLPFTQVPKKSNSFYIGSREVFFKKLDALSIQFDSIEEGDVAAEEEENGDERKKAVLNISFLKHRAWEYIKRIDEADGGGEEVNFTYEYEPSINVLPDNVIVSKDRETNYAGFPVRDSSLAGFMRIDLVSDIESSVIIEKETNKVILPKTFILKNVQLNYSSTQVYVVGIEQSFHIYPFGLIEVFLSEESDDNTKALLKEKEESTGNLIVQTATLLPQFKFGITKEENADLSVALTPTRQAQLLEHKKNYYSLNQYIFEVVQQGNLYIGVENLVPPQNLSLLFKIADGTAADNDQEPPAINWSYLVNNEWRALPPQNIISDSTYGLQTTGIMLFDFPADATNNNTTITNGLHWFCASVATNAARLPKIIDVIAQANKAVFWDKQNDPNHYKVPLPAKTIAKLLVKVPEVKVVEQPFESFDGKMREEGNVFYARGSERLRHKHRAITPWDYEHLVLQHFPSVYKVKCVTHTDPNCICRHPKGATGTADETKCCCGQVAPGHVLIVPVSNLRNKEAVDILKPRTGRRTLIQIEEYLTKLTSTFVHVKALNPTFEEIKTSFSVKFNTGTDKGRYLKKLNQDIIEFLTPWAFDAKKDVVFGGVVYASSVINFIEELNYVDYISCFRMIHVVKGCCERDTLADISCVDLKGAVTKIIDDKTVLTALGERVKTVIEASSPRAILTSVKQHCIELVEEKPDNKECECS